MTHDRWAGRLARVIAGEVRRYRQERSMSAQHLAERTAACGMEIPRSVLANLESGRRGTVSVAELLVLAAALDVPPALLVFPVGRTERTEALPGLEVPPWDALRWFAGRRELAAVERGLTLMLGVTDPDTTVQMFEQHDDLQHSLGRWGAALQATLAAGAGDRGRQEAEAMRGQITANEGYLRDLRQRMRKKGLLPPPDDAPGQE